MTILIDMADWWVEYHQVTQVDVAAGATMAQSITPDRSGRVVGAAGFAQGSGNNAQFGGVEVLRSDGAALSYGLEMGAFNYFVRVQNNAAGLQTLTIFILIFLRK